MQEHTFQLVVFSSTHLGKIINKPSITLHRSGINKQCKSVGFDSCHQPSNLTQIGLKSFFCQNDVWIWLKTSWNNMAPLLCYIQRCASFQSNWWIQTDLQPANAQFGSKLAIFFVLDGLGIWRMILQTTGHLIYATSSFVHHFITVNEFTLELQSGNAQFG